MTDKSIAADPGYLRAKEILKRCAGMTLHSDTATITMTPETYLSCIRAAIATSPQDAQTRIDKPQISESQELWICRKTIHFGDGYTPSRVGYVPIHPYTATNGK